MSKHNIIKDNIATYYYVNDKLHREDGPAIEYNSGDASWYINGLRHRVGGPAKNFSYTKQWWVDGKLHREDGPAVEDSDGNKFWWVNGNLHREDGPAIEYADGDKFWYKNGELCDENDCLIKHSCDNHSNDKLIKNFNCTNVETKMNNVKSEMFDGMLRALTSESVDIIKNGILSFLKEDGLARSDEEQKFLFKLLNSSIGDAVIRFTFGYAGEHIPHPFLNKDISKKVIAELKVSGWEKLAGNGLSMMKKFILPGLSDLFEKFEYIDKLK